MHDDNSIMKVDSVLPEDFDGVFRFTNWSEEDFIGVWGKKEYRFPAKSTSPMIIPDHSPIEIQQIRKKFAKDLAEREFYKTDHYEKLRRREGERVDGMIQPVLNSFRGANEYSLDTLAPFIQRALEPLPMKKAEVTEAHIAPIEDTLSRNEDGELNTTAVDKKTSLREKALKA
jgi:hypothetical protein